MKKLLFILIFFTVSCLYSPHAIADQSDDLSDHLYSQAVEKTVLRNGLTVVFKKAPSTGLASINIKVMAGSAQEAEYAGTGISHFVEHMIFKSTNKRRPAGIEKEIRSHGGTINGATSFDYTSFTITIPSEHISLALKGLSDSLFNPLMDPKEIQKEKSVILKEIKLNRDDPARHISRLLWGIVFRSHPYRHPVIGYESLFKKISRDDILTYYKRMYVPNNMVLVLVADIDREEAFSEINKYFLNKERSAFHVKPLTPERNQVSERQLSVKENIEMAYFALGYRSVNVSDPDMAALDVLSAILGHGNSSRLNSALYRKKNLVYSIGSWNYTPQDPGIFIISGVADPEKLSAALGAIGEEISYIKKGSVSEKEVERVKTMTLASQIYSLKTLSGQASDMSMNELTTGDPTFTKAYLKSISAVKAADVKRVANQYLRNESLSTVTLTPRPEVTSPEVSGADISRNIRKYTLANGLRLLLMEDRSVPTVSIVASCLGGLRAENDKVAGISNLTALMMLKGTISKSEEEISELSEGMGSALTYFSGNNSLGIRLDCLSRDFDGAFNLFNDILTNPDFPEKIIEREKNTVIAMIDSTGDDIFNSGIKSFKEGLYKEHPYRFQKIGLVETVKNISRADLLSFYEKYFIANNMVLAVFGDFDADDVYDKIRHDLEDISGGDSPRFTTIKEPEQKKIRRIEEIVEKEQSLIIMGFKGATLKNKDRYALQVIATTLSGISGRLAYKLREKSGLAYAVGCFSVPAIDPGYLALYVLTTADNIERSNKEFLEQIKLLNNKGLTEEEIDSAKRELIGNQRIALQTSSALAHTVSLDELYGLGYEHYTNYDKIINSITNRDIIEVSRKYLRPDAFTVITVRGEKGG